MELDIAIVITLTASLIYFFGKRVCDAQPEENKSDNIREKGFYFFLIFIAGPYFVTHFLCILIRDIFKIDVSEMNTNIVYSILVIFLIIIQILIDFYLIYGKLDRVKKLKEFVIILLSISSAVITYLIAFIGYYSLLGSAEIFISYFVVTYAAFLEFIALLAIARLFGNDLAYYPRVRIIMDDKDYVFTGTVLKFGKDIRLKDEKNQVYLINRDKVSYIEYL